jgi:hypothetical protein
MARKRLKMMGFWRRGNSNTRERENIRKSVFVPLLDAYFGGCGVESGKLSKLEDGVQRATTHFCAA